MGTLQQANLSRWDPLGLSKDVANSGSSDVKTVFLQRNCLDFLLHCLRVVVFASADFLLHSHWYKSPGTLAAAGFSAMMDRKGQYVREKVVLFHVC